MIRRTENQLSRRDFVKIAAATTVLPTVLTGQANGQQAAS